MARPGSRTTALALEAVVVEGGLIAPEQLAKVAGAEMGAKAAAEYGCPKGTMLRDEIARYYSIGRALWAEYDRIETPTVTQTATFVRDLLSQCFGFTDLTGPHEHREGSRRFRIAWEAKNGRVPVVVAAPVPGGDAFAKSQPEFGDGEGGRARRSPTVLLQDWLNANPSFLWGLVFAGDRIRLMRDNASLTRPAWIEADLGVMFRDEMFADFTALWLLTHATRFGAEGAAPSDCALERWREEGLKQGTSARERLREGVEEALRQLGQGLVEANPEVRERIAHNLLPMTSLFEELLRTVYRLIFLAVAEDRDLLHSRSVPQRARSLYAENYSFTFWRERSRRRVARDHHHDAWEGMKITLGALEHGEPALGLPALGGLFASGATPTLNDARIPNRYFLEAVFNLGFIKVEGSLHRINWRDMKTEELGSVYESLLEIRPYLAPNGDFVLDSGAKGNARKTSGSYYTPDSLVETLLDSALDPVLEKAEANAETPAEKAAAVLDLRVIDPACGSGHFLLGAARRMADRVALWRNPDAGKEEKQAALRDVVSRCVHGTDRNPMAVELAKVALWIESVSPGQPLGFLDANIRCGDALLGVFDLAVLEEGIPDEAYRPLIGDSKDAAKYYGKLNKDAKKGQGQLDFHGGGGAMPPRKLAANLATIKRMPEDTVRQVEEKKRLFEAWRHDPARYATKVACDLYIAAFLLPKTEVPDVRGRDMVPTTVDVRRKLAGGTNYGPMEAVAIDAAEAARSLHWPLAFPDIIVERGGFDVVLGNPPWERIEVQEQEFFSSSHPAIAGAQNAAKRRTMIEALESEEPATFAAWRQALRAAAVEVAYYKGSARFPLGSTGKINTYAVFADLFRQAVNKKGRAGLILPSGLVNGFTYREFLAHLLKTKTIASFYGFENEEKIFKSVHNETKFGVLTLTGEKDPVEQPWFTAHLRQPSQINDPERRYALSIGEIEAINPNTLNLPAFRWAMDAEVTAAIHNAAPVLIRKEPDAQIESPWQISLTTLFNMATDSGKFLDHADVASLIVERRVALAMLSDGREVYPLYEGKMFWHFDHRYGTYEGQTEKQANKGVLPRTSDSQHCDQSYRVEPLYWVEAALTNDILGNHATESSFFSWRDVGPSERTFVGTVIPKTAVGHAAPILLTSETGKSRAALYATLSSLVVDYAARQKSNRMTFFVVEQIPVLRPATLKQTPAWLNEPLEDWLAARVLELCYTNEELRPFALELGRNHPPFRWQPERRVILQAEIDAAMLHLYGLNRLQAEWLMDSFAVLRKYEERDFGEFRTKQIILEIFDQMDAAKNVGSEYLTRLSPPPADASCCHEPQVDTVPDTSEVDTRQWEHDIRDEIDVRLLLAAIVTRMRQPRPLRDVVHAFLFAARPNLLMAHLDADRQTEWRRLVGNAVDLQPTIGVVSFSSAHLGRFNEARTRLAADGAWRFDVETGAVDRGAQIYSITLPAWAEGRADFVWHAMRSISQESAMTALSQEEQTFLAQAAAA